MNYPLSEQKLIYRVLHAALIENPDLMDSEFLHGVWSDEHVRDLPSRAG